MVKDRIVGLLAVALMAAPAPSPAQDAYGDPQAPVAGRVLGTVVHTRDAEELRYVVLQRLTDQYAAANGIAVTQAEKDAYVSQVERALQQDREVQAARRDALKRQLAAPGLSETERGSLAARLDDTNRMLDALAAPVGDPQELQAARDQVAAAFIRQWKINRALHRQYGGRIIFQQGGPEPLDAYRRFLEEHQARGDFAVLDKDLEAAFWRYYRTDAIHSFFPPGSNAEAQAFATPPWQSPR